MASEPTTGKDEFAEAKANIRDTVKWIATTYSALAAFVVGGTSVHGLGGLPPAGVQFWLAVLALAAGFACICIALYITLRILRPVHVYRSDLLYPPSKGRRIDNAEMTIVRSEINLRARDLLPHNYQSLKLIADEVEKTEQILRSVRNPPLTPQEVAERSKGNNLRNKLYAAVNALLPFALYLQLQIRLQRALPWLIGHGVAALVALAIFAVLTHEKKSEEKPGGAVISHFQIAPPTAPPPAAPALPQLKPVLFSTGQADVSDEGLLAIERARNALRNHPEALLLLRAHTDTVAPMPTNVALARRRATVILSLLTGPGGIAPARIFIAELPKTDLPAVTAPETENHLNRSVEMALIRP